MPKTTFTTGCSVKLGSLLPLDPGKSGDYHLRYPLSGSDQEGLCPMIYHDHADLATIICIYRPWRIYQRYAMLEGKSAPWPYLCFKAGGESDGDSCRHKSAAAWQKGDIFRKICIEIHTGGMESHVTGEWGICFRTDSLYCYVYMLHLL
jgi:hypothetical protein